MISVEASYFGGPEDGLVQWLKGPLEQGSVLIGDRLYLYDIVVREPGRVTYRYVGEKVRA